MVRNSSYEKLENDFPNNFYLKQINDFNYEPHYILVDDAHKQWKTISVGFLFLNRINLIFRVKIIFFVLFVFYFIIFGVKKSDKTILK